jgi:hypothetical protein
VPGYGLPPPVLIRLPGGRRHRGRLAGEHAVDSG